MRSTLPMSEPSNTDARPVPAPLGATGSSSARTRRVILGSEFSGFALALATVWLTEAYDPPFSFSQVLIESAALIAVGALVILTTRRLLQRIRVLEGFFAICASCKKVRLDGQWVSIEHFLAHRSDVLLSHGICDDCGRKLYPEIWDEVSKK